MNDMKVTELRPKQQRARCNAEPPPARDDGLQTTADRIAQIDAANDDAAIALDALAHVIDKNPNNDVTPMLELILERFQATKNRIEDVCAGRAS